MKLNYQQKYYKLLDGYLTKLREWKESRPISTPPDVPKLLQEKQDAEKALVKQKEIAEKAQKDADDHPLDSSKTTDAVLEQTKEKTLQEMYDAAVSAHANAVNPLKSRY